MRLLVGALCLLGSVAAAAQEHPDNFAYSVPLELSGDSALHQLEIPQSVYAGVTRGDLGDLRIFNGRGENVPYALKPQPAPQTAPPVWVEVPFFPLHGPRGATADQLDIRAERTPAGTIVSVISGKARHGAPALLGYLLDATGFKQPLQALDLDWHDSGDGVTSSVRVEASDDLEHWRTLVSAAPLVSLEFAGQRLVQKTVELPAARQKYLRLAWPEGQQPIELVRLRARSSDAVLEPARQWRQVPLRSGETAGEYRFEPDGQIPVDRLRISLPEPNALVPVRVMVRHADDQPWRTLATGVLYRLVHDRHETVNADLSVNGSGWEQWLLRLDPRAGGVGTGVPQAAVGWVPQQLVFVARGGGPFLLAYGNARAKPADLPIQTLVPGWRSDGELKAAPATAGPQQTLAGPRALRATPDYKTWALWASLVGAVLVLAWMAWVLARELRVSNPKS